jgi:hypothetical protein
MASASGRCLSVGLLRIRGELAPLGADLRMSISITYEQVASTGAEYRKLIQMHSIPGPNIFTGPLNV